VTGALPADVRSVLAQLFTEARDAVADGDRETARSAVDTATTVTENKVPEGPLRDRLLFGCERVTALLDADQPRAAREYLAAMARRVQSQDAGGDADDGTQHE
jgi:hypothetical protein